MSGHAHAISSLVLLLLEILDLPTNPTGETEICGSNGCQMKTSVRHPSDPYNSILAVPQSDGDIHYHWSNVWTHVTEFVSH